MQPSTQQIIIEILFMVVLFGLFIKGMKELFRPENKQKRQEINDSFREARKNRELIEMNDGSFYCGSTPKQ